MKRGIPLHPKAGFAAGILEILASDYAPDCFAAFCGDGALYLTNDAFSSIQRIAVAPHITNFSGQLKLYFHHPYVCITERFGVNGAVIHLQSGTVFPLCRAPYHEDVSSYSIAFLKRQDSTLLVHQSAWNRLDKAGGQMLTYSPEPL